MFRPSCGHHQVLQIENIKLQEGYAPIWDRIGVTLVYNEN